MATRILSFPAIVFLVASAAVPLAARADDAPPDTTLYIRADVQYLRPHPSVRTAPLQLRTDGVASMVLTDTGTIEFGEGATIDFADYARHAGRLRGFVYVRVQGERMLMPVFALPVVSDKPLRPEE